MGKFLCILFFAAACLGVFFLPHLAEARVPYVYQWVTDSDSNIGISQLDIQFDYPVDTVDKELIILKSKDTTVNLITLKQDQDFSINYLSGNSKISIKFLETAVTNSEGESIDIPLISAKYPDVKEWEIYLPIGSLTFTTDAKYEQLLEIVIPFNVMEVEPGFRSTFMTASSSDINSRILTYNPLQNIIVYPASNYITGLKTIHRYEGIFHDDTLTPPQLSNIEISTSDGVDQVFVTVGNTPERKLSLDPVSKNFTTGYAGLSAGLRDDENGDDITIKAYNVYGKLLEERSFKLKVSAAGTNISSDFIVEDYIPTSSGGSSSKGSASPVPQYNLYDLVKDPALAETILSKIPAGELDNLKLFYPNKLNMYNIDNLHSLADALASTMDTKLLSLNAALNPTTDISINNSLILDGKNNKITFQSGKKLLVGDGSADIEVTLRNLTVTGDLDINAGSGGIVHLDNVTVSGTTTVLSGGIDSIYLNNFASTIFKIQNTDPVRIIVQGTTSLASTIIDAPGAEIILALDMGSGSPSFGSITGECGDLTWGAGGDFPMTSSSPNIDIQGNVAINTGANTTVNTNNIYCTGTVTNNSGVMQALQLNANTITESSRNDGSIEMSLAVTQNKGIFVQTPANVAIDNLPAGLNITVTRNSATRITVGFTGNAASHTASDSLDNLTVEIGSDDIVGCDNDLSSAPFSIAFQDNLVPSNQDVVFKQDVFVNSGRTISIVSSGNIANEIWFAPIANAGNLYADNGQTMSMVNGTSTTITAPTEEGYYKLFIKEPGGNVSRPSTATLVVDNTAPINNLFTSSTKVKGGTSIQILSSDDITNKVWFAPEPTAFSAGSTMTKADTGIATSILAPASEGDYHLYVVDAAGNISGESAGVLTVDNTAPNNQNTVFPSSVTTAAGCMVTINPGANEADNQIWFAPLGTTAFVEGNSMTKGADGQATTISAPQTPGTYKLFIIDPAGNRSQASAATLTINNSPPAVTNVSSTNSNGRYGVGQTISVSITFSKVVEVTGTPQLILVTGTAATTPAVYVDGSGTSTLMFEYVVASGDLSSDLNYQSTASLELNRGTIKDAAGTDATLTLPSPGASKSLGANKSIIIDGVQATVVEVTSSSANRTYKIGDIIPVQVKFSEAVTVTGTPQISLLTDEALGNSTLIDFSSGSGTNTLVFNYTVADGDNADDLDYETATALDLNGGTIKDSAGNDADLELAAPTDTNSLAENKALVIDGIKPVVTGVTSTKPDGTPTPDGTYKIGDVINVTVSFDGNVTVTGTPTIALATGSPATTQARYTSGTGTDTLSFSYTIAEGHNSLDLDYAATTSLAGTIKDSAGNLATLTLAAPGAANSLGNNKNIEIDGVKPVISSVQLTPDSGANNKWDEVGDVLTITFSENVSVSGGNLTVSQLKALLGNTSLAYGTGTTVTIAGAANTATLTIGVAALNTGLSVGANVNGITHNSSAYVNDTAGNTMKAATGVTLTTP